MIKSVETIYTSMLSEPGVSKLPEKTVRDIAAMAVSIADYKEKLLCLDVSEVNGNSISCVRIDIYSPTLSSLFTKRFPSARAVFFCITLGEVFDNALASLSNQIFLHSYLLDLAGSKMLSLSLDSLMDKLQVHSNPNNTQPMISMPVMPGSCGWDIGTGLNDIFRVLKPLDIGVRLSGGMMVPNKSMAGVFFESADLKAAEPCAWCRKGKCGKIKMGG